MIHTYDLKFYENNEFLYFQSKFTCRSKGWSESTRNPMPSSWVVKLRVATVAPNYQVFLLHMIFCEIEFHNKLNSFFKNEKKK